MNTIVAISDLRKRFGEIEAALPHVDYITITKKGRPFALLSAVDDVKRTVIKNCAGAIKSTDLDDDAIWREVLKRKSRKKQVRI